MFGRIQGSRTVLGSETCGWRERCHQKGHQHHEQRRKAPQLCASMTGLVDEASGVLSVGSAGTRSCPGEMRATGRLPRVGNDWALKGKETGMDRGGTAGERNVNCERQRAIWQGAGQKDERCWALSLPPLPSSTFSSFFYQGP